MVEKSNKPKNTTNQNPSAEEGKKRNETREKQETNRKQVPGEKYKINHIIITLNTRAEAVHIEHSRLMCWESNSMVVCLLSIP